MPVTFQLKELLSEHNMTQLELQKRSGLAYSTINEIYLNKMRRVDLDTLDAICKVLKCEIGDLMVYKRR